MIDLDTRVYFAKQRLEKAWTDAAREAAMEAKRRLLQAKDAATPYAQQAIEAATPYVQQAAETAKPYVQAAALTVAAGLLGRKPAVRRAIGRGLYTAVDRGLNTGVARSAIGAGIRYFMFPK